MHWGSEQSDTRAECWVSASVHRSGAGSTLPWRSSRGVAREGVRQAGASVLPFQLGRLRLNEGV